MAATGMVVAFVLHPSTSRIASFVTAWPFWHNAASMAQVSTSIQQARTHHTLKDH